MAHLKTLTLNGPTRQRKAILQTQDKVFHLIVDLGSKKQRALENFGESGVI